MADLGGAGGGIMIRFESYPLKWDERPKKLYQYYVSGRGIFPYDMLRFDSAWPATTDDAHLMFAEHSPGIRSVQIRSYKEPTIERWSSFLWSVGLEKL